MTRRRGVTNRSLRLQVLQRPKTPPIETVRRDLCPRKTPFALHREGTWSFDRYAPHRESGALLQQAATAGLAGNRDASGVFAQERVRALPRLAESWHMRSALARRVQKRAPMRLKRGQRWAIRRPPIRVRSESCGLTRRQPPEAPPGNSRGEASTAPQQTRVCPHPRRAPVSTELYIARLRSRSPPMIRPSRDAVTRNSTPRIFGADRQVSSWPWKQCSVRVGDDHVLAQHQAVRFAGMAQVVFERIAAAVTRDVPHALPPRPRP